MYFRRLTKKPSGPVTPGMVSAKALPVSTAVGSGSALTVMRTLERVGITLIGAKAHAEAVVIESIVVAVVDGLQDQTCLLYHGAPNQSAASE